MNKQHLSLSGTEKISLISNLSTMLTAGIPILEAVDSIRIDAKGNQRKILEELRVDLTGGNRIYLTFAKFPNVFDKVTISVIKAAEEAGTLDVTLADLRTNIQKEMEFSDKVKAALLYPTFIIIIFLAVLLLMLIVVIPRISQVFMRLRVTLPLPTKILIFLSNFLLGQPLAVAFGGGLIIFMTIYLFKRKRKFMYGMLFSLPLVSGLVKEIDLTKFSRNLYLLLYSGIPITSALELVADVVVKEQMSKIIYSCRQMILSGKKLSEGLRDSHGYVPMIMVRLIEAGEKTGSLDKSMQDISEYYDYQVTKTLKTLTALLEPIMLVLVGIIVGSMMLAIISPIYGLISQVGSR